MPIVSRVILAAHEILMQGGNGDKSSPGSFRQQSVRVGQLVPPMAPHVPSLIKDLEIFMNDDESIFPLIKAGLAHVQFETIHPFLDGNGRIGRLLIVLMMINDGLISEPILYPSYGFKKRHSEYYAALDKVRLQGDFEGWIRFYLQALIDSAEDAWVRAKDIECLEMELKSKIREDRRFLKTHEDALRLLFVLFQFPVIGITQVAELLNRSYNSVSALMEKFEEAGIVNKISEQRRNKTYLFKGYLKVLEKEY